jgi:hypothetical protein
MVVVSDGIEDIGHGSVNDDVCGDFHGSSSACRDLTPCKVPYA